MKSPPATVANNEVGYRTSILGGKDWSMGLIKIVTFMVIFISGLILGLTAGVHVIRYVRSPTEIFFPTQSTVICKTDDCLNLGKFVNPGKLTHEMTDMELFWRASLVSKKKDYPYKRVPKVAFLFLTSGPLPFLKLWERFFKGQEELFSIYVHALPGNGFDVERSSVFYGRQIPSKKVHWGSVELVDAERRLLANALLDFSNERFVLLSESCIPVYNFPTVYEYLIGSSQSFVEAYDDPSRYGRGRYSQSMLPHIKLRDWRKGSQWFELSRTLAVNIVADSKYYELFSWYCKPSCYPDEHYIPTVLNMFYGSLNSNRTVTWVDWSRGGSHPATFGARDITEKFLRDIREGNGTTCIYNSKETNVCYIFARKFAPSALKPLLSLAATLMKF